MAEHAEALVRRTKKLGIMGFGALAVTGAFLAFGAGTAGADVDDVEGDSSAPSAFPVAEDGIRVAGLGVANAGPSEVRAARIGAPLPPAGGESKDSLRAVPSTTARTYLWGPIDDGIFDSGGPEMFEW
ncbi:MAG: hypothetical protein SV966_06025 [Actinomycetota bacterium]|nr:hypothetical protein [Actinomycetota bacterium]